MMEGDMVRKKYDFIKDLLKKVNTNILFYSETLNLFNTIYWNQEQNGYSSQVGLLDRKCNNQKVQIDILEKDYDEAINFREIERQEAKETETK